MIISDTSNNPYMHRSHNCNNQPEIFKMTSRKLPLS